MPEIRVIKAGESFVLGKCQCGYCNEDIPISPGRYGFLRRFKYGHNAKGVNNPKYRGNGKTSHNYDWLNMPWHPNSDIHGRVYTHVWLMTKKLGRPLNKGEVIHHIIPISKGGTNDIENLMLCEGQGEHRTEHRIDKTNWFCSICGGKTTFDKNNYEKWYKDGKGGHICRGCYTKKNYKYIKKK